MKSPADVGAAAGRTAGVLMKMFICILPQKTKKVNMKTEDMKNGYQEE